MSPIPTTQETPSTLTYRAASVDGLKVFYRQAGDPKAPTVLLLHGFPTSSHMYLITQVRTAA
jgi:pimeloyl-ACP methyl ester carboxylesterase